MSANLPVQAIGPPGLAAMARHIELAYSENIREHLKAHPCSPDGYKITVREVTGGCVYADDKVSVQALAADHGDLAALSYKFETPAGTVVVSGDTKPAPAFAEWARGCDLAAARSLFGPAISFSSASLASLSFAHTHFER